MVPCCIGLQPNILRNTHASRKPISTVLSSNSGKEDEEPKILVNFDSDTGSGDKLLVEFADATSGDGVINGVTIEDIKVDDTEYGATYSLNGYTDSSIYHRSLKADGPQLDMLSLTRVEELNEDGYGDMMKRKKRSFVNRAFRLPFKLLRRVSNGSKIVEPGNLILVSTLQI